ncbi:MAG: lysophospholipid acyltransferase family protein [Acidiferrobacterales bacterium]
MRLIASLLYHTITVVSLIIYVPIVLLTFPFPFAVRYGAVRRWGGFMVWVGKWLCGIDFVVEGRENIPQGATIVMGKHQSTWETFAFQQIFPPQVWVLKRELLRLPFFGWGLALMEPIAIDRGAGHRAVDQIIEQGRKRLQDGRWVVVFPEGTRVPRGKRRKYGMGGAVLAVETGYPVLPVAHNAGTYWPRRSARLYPGTIRVVIGPAIDPKGLTAEEIRDRAQNWIETKMMELEGRSEMAELITARHPGKAT